MNDKNKLKDGAACTVIGGTHKGKNGTIQDINTSKGGNITLTVVQESGLKFKTLAKHIEITA